MIYFRSFWIQFFVILLVACNKENPPTTINGVVLDKQTNEPIKGVHVAIRITDNSIQSSNNFHYKDLTTDQMGAFSFSSIDEIAIYDVQRSGYLPKNSKPCIPYIDQGKLNEVEIKMTPMDGVLSLKIHNASNFIDTVYIGIYSPSLDEEHFFSHGVALRDFFVVEAFDSKITTLNLASEDSIGIYLGLTTLPFDIKTAAYHEFVSVTRNDTTSFNISF